MPLTAWPGKLALKLFFNANFDGLQALLLLNCGLQAVLGKEDALFGAGLGGVVPIQDV